jgi:hypothetical protein
LFLIPLVPSVAAADVPDCDDLSALCKEPRDVYLPTYQHCLWKGSYKVLVETPVLRVWHYTCDDPHSLS